MQASAEYLDVERRDIVFCGRRLQSLVNLSSTVFIRRITTLFTMASVSQLFRMFVVFSIGLPSSRHNPLTALTAVSCLSNIDAIEGLVIVILDSRQTNRPAVIIL